MKLLFIIILSFVSVDCFAQNYELDSLQRRKNDLSNRLHQLKDSLREVENEISQIKAKQLVSQFKDSSIEATVRAGAKFKSNPEFQAKVVLTLNKESTVKILNHENNYFYVCSGNICGYVSQQWIVSTTVVEEFKVAKANERHSKEKKALEEKKEKERIEREEARRIKEKTQAEKERLLAESKKQKLESEIKAIKEREANLIKKYGERIGKRITAKQIWIGMSKQMLLDSRGTPDDINKSVGSWGVHEQWVYDKGNYKSFIVYVENGVVTSWQDW